MNNYQLLSALLNHLQPLLPLAREAILLNLALTVLSLAQSHDCHLATLVTVWPVKVKRTSLIQRLRRWLLNKYLTPRIYYLPLAKHLLQNWLPLSTLKPKKGERLYIQQIYLTKKHNFGLVNLIVNWSANEDYPRYIILDTFADRHAWRRGRKRFWIEPTFRDWKSYGFLLSNSKLNKPHQIRSMVLAMAITYLWMLYLAQTLIKDGQREMFESSPKIRL